MTSTDRQHLDTSLTATERADALLAQMTVAEKAHQVAGVMAWEVITADGGEVDNFEEVLSRPPGHIAQLIRDTPAQLADTIGTIQHRFVERSRLGIPLLFHAEALNGLLAGGHMVFPTAIGLAATWRPDLVEEMADLMRQQLVRVGIRHALSPVMDVALDPRWGRVHETYGEDPYLVAINSVAYTRGMQSRDLAGGVIATGKHFLGYAAPESGLNAATIPVGPRRLRDLFAVPFEAAIREAGLASIMNSYSDIDGIPVAASRQVLTSLLRDELGFDGFVSADYDSISQLFTRQGVASDLAEAGRLALQAGLDVEFPQPLAYGDLLCNEVEAGRVESATLDLSVRRVLEAKFRLGLFENPYPSESIDVAQTAIEGDDLSRDLARRSVVVLENDGILPVKLEGVRVAVVGPHADSPDLQFAAYSYPSWRQAVDAIHFGGERTMVGVDNTADAWHQALLPAGVAHMIPRERYGTLSLLDALDAAGAKVSAIKGSGLTSTVAGGVGEVSAVAADADLVVVALGGGSLWFSGERTEGEASDTANIDLPEAQKQVLDAVAESGTPFIIVMVQGRPYPLPASASRARALVVSTFGGPHGSSAVVDVLTGAVEPVGRLPYSIPRDGGQLPIYHHKLTGSGGHSATSEYRTAGYLDMPATAAYPFGAGLGYSTFELADLSAPAEVSTTGTLTFSLRASNVGDVDGSTIVQAYARVRVSGIVRPFQQLIGFQHVSLKAGHSATVTFTVDATQFAATDEDLRLTVEPATIEIFTGFDSSDSRLVAKTSLTGPRHVVDRAKRHFFSQSVVGAEERL